MKKLIIILLFLTSCAELKPIYYSIGETQQQFLADNRGSNVNVVKDNPNYTLYSICNSWGLNCTYYLFKNNRLCEMSEGERGPDIVIENR